ncbi:MAG TPA: acyl carrier protein [Phycisphaerae bacterium]|nr:acyl carrier protein [Phycisphaerae bacterium]HRY68138.1 acyl carrier protein [Phycisphaerae bacterium]HSA27034.1 acyl carrier protein [Phycisphaerae bacterium]
MPAIIDRDKILDRVCSLAAAQANMTRAEVTAECNLFTDLNFDSLDQMEFVMAIEDEFDVSVPDERAENVKTVGQAVDVLLSFIQAKAVPVSP